MSKQLLIYEKAVPVSSQKHRDWSVKAGEDYEFARRTNAIPLTTIEFPAAAAEYAIVFAGTDQALMPAVLLGVRHQENLYLTPDGQWKARYVPAFVRRYPFVFSSTDDGKNFTLCIDEQFAGLNKDGRGERLFDSDGKRTQYLETVLAFLKQYQAQFQRTLDFCKKLKDLDVLDPMHAQVTLPDGNKLNLAGFQAVNRDKLKNLSGDQLSELIKSDHLELVYIHLQSMRNFTGIGERIGDAAPPQPGAGEASPHDQQVAPAASS